MGRSLALVTRPHAVEDAQPTPEEFAALARFRLTLRQFMAFSEQAAADLGMTMQWYQALLVIKTRGAERPVSVGELAEELLIKDHSAAELVSRLREDRDAFLSVLHDGED
jgi:DNA-binding MarR family transcriptional regulator